MDRSLYVAMTGATQTLRAQAANSHNLANASTAGFRATLAATQALAVEGPGMSGARINALLQEPGWDARAGSVQQTGRNLDIALAEDRWLAVQASDGSEAYTRAGDLQLDANGQLRTSSGLAVFSDGGLMSVPPASSLSIGSDGTVSLIPLGQGANAPAQIGRLKVVEARPDQLRRGEDGLMRSTAGPLNPAPGVVLTAGALESSNVSLPECMVTMIQLARQFELQTKAMRAAEDNATASATLVRL